MGYPTDRKYTKEHEWIKPDGGSATIGITDHAQQALGDIVVDFKKNTATKNHAPLELSPREFRILKYFTEHMGEVVTRDQLLDHVWGYDSFPLTRTVDTHIAKLRQKIEENPGDPHYIVTVHRAGYKFVG